jgi:hypothetical protein
MAQKGSKYIQRETAIGAFWEVPLLITRHGGVPAMACSTTEHIRSAFRTIVLVFLLLLASTPAYALKVFEVRHPSQADFKVYRVRHASQADLKIHWVRRPSQSRGDALWYRVDHPSQAQARIYYVEHPSQADLKLFEVHHASQAGWVGPARGLEVR